MNENASQLAPTDELAILFADHPAELPAMTALAERLEAVLVMRAAPAYYRTRLYEGLMLAAENAAALPPSRWHRLPQRRTVGLAATASAVSVALGVVTYWALSRTRAMSGPHN